jgi:hypothetical protein
MDLIVREESPKKIGLFLHSITIAMIALLAYASYNQSSDIATLNHKIIANTPINTEQTRKIADIT